MIFAVLGGLLSLADVERAALARAPLVVQARAVVSERAALLDAARGTGLPQAFATYAQAPQGGASETIVQRMTTAGLQFSIGDAAARSPAVAQASFEDLAARADELAAERVERVKAASLYFDAMRARDIFALRQTIVRSGRADVRAARLRFAAGDAPRLDVVRADVALAQAQADLATARADDANARHALAVEIGRDDATLALPDLGTLPLTAAIPASPEAAVAIALAHRPEVASARAGVWAEQAAVRGARRATLPGISAQLGWSRGIDSGIAVSGPSAIVTLNVPLSHAAAARADAERARLAQAQARFDAQAQNVDVEVSSALRTYLGAVDSAAAASRARAEAMTEVSATEEGYRNGASSSLDVDDARRAYAQAAVNATVASAAAREAAAILAITMGISP
ncbi:MAG TPA: TolC family protein [Candidatus Baltobacteraceae bacterium]